MNALEQGRLWWDADVDLDEVIAEREMVLEIEDVQRVRSAGDLVVQGRARIGLEARDQIIGDVEPTERASGRQPNVLEVLNVGAEFRRTSAGRRVEAVDHRDGRVRPEIERAAGSTVSRETPGPRTPRALSADAALDRRRKLAPVCNAERADYHKS